MNQADALKHIRVLVNAASKSDDTDLIYKLLREMRGIVNSALPISPKRRVPSAPAKRKTAKLARELSLKLVK